MDFPLILLGAVVVLVVAVLAVNQHTRWDAQDANRGPVLDIAPPVGPESAEDSYDSEWRQEPREAVEARRRRVQKSLREAALLPEETFETLFEEHLGSYLEHRFYSVVAGTSHANRDGSNRCAIIRKCRTGDQLAIIPEPDNPVDPCAMGIWRTGDGGQLGYVKKRAAHEIEVDMRRSGGRWAAWFVHPNHHPETGHVVGAVVILGRFRADVE